MNKKLPPKDPRMARYLRARAEYEDGTSTMSDAEYDSLEAALRKDYPDLPIWGETGSPVGKKQAILLPRYMPSLNKKYPADLKGNEVFYDVVMPKLDGCSLQLKCTKQAVTGLYTRGDGTEGKDISFLLPYLKFPKPIDDSFLRCEAILTKYAFDRIVIEQKRQKVKNPYTLARNAVAGLLNCTTRNVNADFLSMIRFVIISEYDRPLSDLDEWQKAGWDVIPRRYDVRSIDLEKILADVKARYDLEVDGLVVLPKDQPIRAAASKPDYMWAFKVNAAGVETEVTDIVWSASRFGVYAPTVHIKPVVIAGSKISKLTGHNYQWLVDAGLGIGSTIVVVKAGDVIPYIDKVLTESSDLNLPGVYDRDGVHIRVPKDHDSAEVADGMMVKRIEHFLSTMGVEHYKAKSIEAMLPQLPTISSYLRMWQDRSYSQIEEVLGQAAVKSLEQQMEKAFDRPDLLRFMKATGLFNADSSLDDVVAVHGTQEVLLNLTDAKLRRVAGWGDKKIKAVLDNFVPFLAAVEVAEGAGIEFNMAYSRKGQTVAFTGYRSKEEEEILTAAGYQVVKYSAKVNILLYKEGSKTDKVRKHNNPMLFSQLQSIDPNLRK